MAGRTYKICLILLIVLLQEFEAGEIKPGRCPNSRYAKQKCTIHQVNVIPNTSGCTQDQPCKLKRGTKFTVNFEFTPGFQGKRIKSLPYWDGPNLSFPGLSEDACIHTKCPFTDNTRKNYTRTLSLEPYFPPGRYPVVWRLWNEKNEQCCFLVHIKLI